MFSYIPRMNRNVVLGIIAFICWSAFSTWYYVTQIKDFEDQNMTVAVSKSVAAEPIESKVIQDTLVSVTEVVPTIPFEVNRTVNFEKDSEELINPALFSSFMDSIQNTNGGQNTNIQLTGYTCDLGTEKYNLALGQQRADKIKKSLESKFPTARISTESKGESEPLKPNTSETNREANRRVNITITTNK
ncbi:MAG: outer membrane protein OmpA-like peptidoglycan-associated protein [Marinoscillum sp.]|jgi:outer membrane protein OmpA-like peptidoglycan-associated protein